MSLEKDAAKYVKALNSPANGWDSTSLMVSRAMYS